MITRDEVRRPGRVEVDYEFSNKEGYVVRTLTVNRAIERIAVSVFALGVVITSCIGVTTICRAINMLPLR